MNYTAILQILIGVLFWKVFSNMFAENGATNVIRIVLRIIGILLVVVGAFNFVVSLIN